jgi:chaperonin GroES
LILILMQRARNAPSAEELQDVGTSLKPLADGVLVSPKPKEEVPRSGIVLPDTATEKPQQGTVVAVGPGRLIDTGTRLAFDVRQGDTILFTKYGGTEVKLDDREYLVIRESDLLAIVTNGRSN